MEWRMGFLISVVGVESLPNHLLPHTNAQHTTTVACFFKKDLQRPRGVILFETMMISLKIRKPLLSQRLYKIFN